MKELVHLLWPEHEIVRWMLVFMLLYLLYSLAKMEFKTPPVPRQAVAESEGRLAGHHRIVAGQTWELHYRERVLSQVKLIADLHHSDWKAIMDANRAIILESIDRFRPVANVVLLIGLATTVMGLAITVSQMQDTVLPALRAGDLRAMDNDLRKAFSNIGSAFSGTFWGVVGALLFNALYIRRRTFIQYCLTANESLLLEQIRPMLPPSPGAYLVELRQVASQIKTVVDDLKVIVKEFGPTMKSASEEFRSALDISGKVVRESIDALKTESQHIRSSLENAASTLDVAVQKVGGVTDAISHSVNKLGNAHVELLRAVHEQFGMWKKHLEQVLGTTAELREDFKEQTLRIVQQLSYLSARIGDSVIQMNELKELFSLAKIDLADLLEKHYRDASEEIKSSIAAASQHMNQLEATFQSLAASSDEILARIDLVTSEFRSAIDHATSAAGVTEERMKKMADHMRTAVGTISRMSEQVYKTLETLQGRMLQSGSHVELSSTEFSSAMEQLTTVVKEHYSNMKHLLQVVEKKQNHRRHTGNDFVRVRRFNDTRQRSQKMRDSEDNTNVYGEDETSADKLPEL